MGVHAMPSVTRVAVTVTFLRMDAAPTTSPEVLPGDVVVRRLAGPSVASYRYLYDTVGAQYLWWLRRTVPDMQLAAILRDPRVGIHVLYRADEPVGFYELDARNAAATNLSYFGLMPQAIGCGLGGPALSAAITTAFAAGARALTVNTCTADHPRALPTYLRLGFRQVRAVRELWDVPEALGMPIAEHLKVV